ncbi:MAG: TlpA disulfide reductase family protein [Ginsengibacter sp.]
MKRKILFAQKYVPVFCIILFATLSVHWTDKVPALKEGTYQFIINRPDGKKIVFNSIVKDSVGKKILYVINGSDRLLVDKIVTRKDSVFIQLPFFASSFSARLDAAGNLEGVWTKDYGTRIQTLPFTATLNVKERFPVTTSPSHNISGRWAVHFTRENNRTTESVGEFRQSGSYLTGTFLHSSGDYRFLEGVVSGDSLYLSGFDGGNAFLFTAKINNENKISEGKLYSGKQSSSEWVAERDSTAKLPDGFTLTSLKPDAGKLNFSFPDVDGKKVSLNDKQFKNKVVVIQIMGSWCPNCMDEAKFIGDHYKTFRDKGIEFIGLAYERTTDFKASQKALQPFIKRFNIQYPILITGVAVSDTLRTEKTLPQIDKITVFPTTIFIDKKGNVRKIHTGFDGPATGEHYITYQKEFDEITNELLNEPVK